MHRHKSYPRFCQHYQRRITLQFLLVLWHGVKMILQMLMLIKKSVSVIMRWALVLHVVKYDIYFGVFICRVTDCWLIVVVLLCPWGSLGRRLKSPLPTHPDLNVILYLLYLRLYQQLHCSEHCSANSRKYLSWSKQETTNKWFELVVIYHHQRWLQPLLQNILMLFYHYHHLLDKRLS